MFDYLCSFTPSQNNITPLYVASKEGHHDIVKTLLVAGADMNITSDVSDVMFYYLLCVHDHELIIITIANLTNILLQYVYCFLHVGAWSW